MRQQDVIFNVIRVKNQVDEMQNEFVEMLSGFLQRLEALEKEVANLKNHGDIIAEIRRLRADIPEIIEQSMKQEKK